MRSAGLFIVTKKVPGCKERSYASDPRGLELFRRVLYTRRFRWTF